MTNLAELNHSQAFVHVVMIPVVFIDKSIDFSM